MPAALERLAAGGSVDPAARDAAGGRCPLPPPGPPVTPPLGREVLVRRCEDHEGKETRFRSSQYGREELWTNKTRTAPAVGTGQKLEQAAY